MTHLRQLCNSRLLTHFFLLTMFGIIMLAVAFSITPPVALADTPFVPCDGSPLNPCGSCEVVTMANTIIQWLIGFTFMLFAVLFAIAGFKLVTSGGDTAAKSAAKSSLVNALIGLLLILAAWLMVDTLMKAVLDGNEDGEADGEIVGWGPWAQVECFYQTHTEPWQIDPASEVVLPSLECSVAADGTNTNCSTQIQLCEDTGGTASVDTSNPSTHTLVCDSAVTAVATTTPTAACSPLTPITDPSALQMENGTKVIWANTDSRLQVCAAKKGGTVVSAYRPPAYQAHLKEIHTKWCSQDLQSNTDPACSAVKSQVGAEMAKHGLSCSRPVATNSNHSTGIALDMSGAPRDDSHCLKWFGAGDPVHYTLISGCSCN